MSEGVASATAAVGAGNGSASAGQASVNGSESNVSMAGESAESNTSESGSEESAKDESVKLSPKDRWKSIIQKNYADIDGENEDSFFESAIEMQETNLKKIKELSDWNDKNNKLNKKLLDTLEAYPDMAEALKDMVKGAEPIVALARHFDFENITPIVGDPDYDAWQKAVDDRMKAKAEREKYAREVDINYKNSLGEMELFVKDRNLSQEEAMKFYKVVDQMVADIYKGKITKKTLDNLFKAVNYDDDVVKAEKKGEVNGKNQRIEMKKELDEKKTGDGLPSLANASQEQEPVEDKRSAFEKSMDLAIQKDNRFTLDKKRKN